MDIKSLYLMAAIIVTITSTTGIVGNIFHRVYKNKVRKGIAVPSPKHRFWNEVYPILDGYLLKIHRLFLIIWTTISIFMLYDSIVKS